ncbi:hypothetical protein Pst134EA_026951 [Puccinia striiformis f. sp. tritici]|uniref:hypothetical protein n=1 Tax=Puccinia striiformis f. sp. tritici TaxID=168172 RepID=UPI0020088ED7|nr:hypothetical protein Pst134EA_026951 [Puccinia striiformis f. sp. tritici]KAH9450243.1 hypothetical protein Pst134EA_026951 [Puccinia striiformis f. sp. tritici]
MPSSNKRGANWLTEEDKQLAKSWLKITEDPIKSTGQKKEDFFKRVAEDYNRYAGTVERDWTQVMNRQQTLRNSSRFLRDIKKEFREQEGKQFVHKLAWMVVEDSDKFKTLIQNRGSNNQQATSPITASTPSTPAVTGESQTNTVVSIGSNTSYNRPPGVHMVKRAMKEEHFNAKKIKVMTDRSSDYRDRTLAMQKTNKIRQQVAKAEESTWKSCVRSRRTYPMIYLENSCDFKRRAFLRICKKRRCAEEKAKKAEASTNMCNQHTHPAESLHADDNEDINQDEDINQNANHSEYSNNNNGDNEEEFIDPILY